MPSFSSLVLSLVLSLSAADVGVAPTSPNNLSVSVVGTAPEAFGAATPFILVARVKVQEGKKAEYLRAAAVADRGVMLSEPGMLHHTFDVDPDTPNSFVWSEVYSRSCTKILGACWPRSFIVFCFFLVSVTPLLLHT